MNYGGEKVYREYTLNKTEAELIGDIGFGHSVKVDTAIRKNILIVGQNSYIGKSLIAYIDEHYSENFSYNAISVRNEEWKDQDFSNYDVIIHLAGIAHADVGNASEEEKERYYKVNTDLAVDVAKKAKKDGVKEFVYMSSMIVYGNSGKVGTPKIVTAKTVPNPANFYGDSKLQADVAIREMSDDNFKVMVIRPPMIYGKGSKGNFATLAKLANKMPVFPSIDNARSMLYIDNLSEFMCQLMLIRDESIKRNATIFLPQNAEWEKTANVVKLIATAKGKKIVLLGILNPFVRLFSIIPGKIGNLANKAFGNMVYDLDASRYDGIDYQRVGMEEAVELMN